MQNSLLFHYKKISLKKKVFLPVIAFLAAGFLLIGAQAHAMTPTLSLAMQSDGDTVVVTVNGDANVSVLMFYNKTGVGQTIASLGTTNSSGFFSEGISSAGYGIASNIPVYVTTGGLNGSQSSTVDWPYVSGSGSGSFTLSQTSIALSVGQSSTITASGNSGSLYLSNNSNSAVANVNVSGDQITVTGIENGSTTATICMSGNTSNCPSIYITVENIGTQTLSFSQNNVTIASGVSIPITISGGTGLYMVLNNSNPNAVETSINGSVITLTAETNNSSSSVTVCSTDSSSCGIINVTVGTSGSSSVISFDQNSPTVSIGQSITVLVSGGGSGGAYYVSTNSSPNIVQAAISNGALTLSGLQNGSSAVTVCSSAGGCGTLTATVNYVSSGGEITLSQSSLSLLVGQTLSVTVSGGTAPYSLPDSSNTYMTANISGDVLTVYGVSAGSEQLAVCSQSGGCTWLSVTVNGEGSGTVPTLSQSSVSLGIGQSSTISISGSGSYYLSANSSPSIMSASISGSDLFLSGLSIGSGNISICESGGSCAIEYVTVGSTNEISGQPILAQSSVSLAIGQSSTVSVSGTGSYYISTNSAPDIATASISGSSVFVSAVSTGSTNVSICESGGSCTTLFVSVGSTTPPVGCSSASGFSTVNGQSCAGYTYPVSPAVPVVPTASSYTFTSYLVYGDTGAEVLELQQLLSGWGFLSVTPNGRFGPSTEAAVKAFQGAHSITKTGTVGPSTRSELNQLQITSGGSTTRAQQEQALQLQIQQLQAQLNALEAGQ